VTPATAYEEKHHVPRTLGDRLAKSFIGFLRFTADLLFAKRYGNRAVVLETVAAVPGMVGATLQHLRSLRRMRSDNGWIQLLLDEAENERMHLMTFVQIATPSRFEKIIIVLVQVVFYIAFFVLYLMSPRTAHRLVGYLEEEAVRSYTDYLAGIDSGLCANVKAPSVAIDYWQLDGQSCLRDIILKVREDEAHHRDVNHGLAERLS
jgi:ubiquinol oxidase